MTMAGQKEGDCHGGRRLCALVVVVVTQVSTGDEMA